MDRRRPPRLKALLLQILVLLQSSSTVKLHRQNTAGVDRHLQCVNDYLYTMNCSLIIPEETTSASNKSYWLRIRETTDELEYECLLTNTTGGYFCSINKPDQTPDNIFSDMDGYEISLCQSRDDRSSCEVLDEDYNPELYIKPNAPCCLTVGHNSSQVHFTWRSTYEDYGHYTKLGINLQYQLLLYKTEDNNTEEINIDTERTQCTADTSKLVERFVSDAEYAARVRSSPNMVHYQGQWSDWSSEVLWRTDPAVNDGLPGRTFVEIPVVFGALCVIVLIVLVLYYGPIKMWRKSTFIPTPALYFHSLYKDYQGDFKSWVVTQENTVGTLKAEETLKIDTLVQCGDAQGDRTSQVFQRQQVEGSGYRNIPAPDSDADLSALCTGSSWPSAQWSSGNSLPAWSESGSPAGDSGCWLCSDTSLEREPPWYCNEYCTLSCDQRSSCVSADHHENPACSTEVIGVNAVRQ